jgi:hypothetical protein
MRLTADNHTKWFCPAKSCSFTITTLPTPYAPTHRCTPITSTTTTLKPADTKENK